jgi:hypothetical protein
MTKQILLPLNLSHDIRFNEMRRNTRWKCGDESRERRADLKTVNLSELMILQVYNIVTQSFMRDNRKWKEENFQNCFFNVLWNIIKIYIHVKF